MDGRRWVLLLILYVTLDFAAPLMPGAIYFDNGTLRVVAGAQCRAEPAMGCLRAPVQGQHPITPHPSVSSPFPRETSVLDRSPRRTAAGRRVPNTVEPASASPDDQ